MLPILLIHAAGGAARNFGSVLRRLPAASAIDLPGHGRAGGEAPRSIEDAARVVAPAAPAGPFVIGGHSMGGAIALTMAAAADEVAARIRGVVLIAAGARLQMSRAVAAKARADWEGFLNALHASGSPLMTVEALRQCGQETVARDLEAATAWEGLPYAAKVKVPVLLIAGERDRTAPVALIHELAAALPDARVVVVPGAGHVLPVEKPEEVAREIEGFAESLVLRP